MIVGAWLALSLSFGYVFNYVAYKTGDDNFAGDGASNAQLLSELMPSAIPDVIVSGLPMFGGALAMVVGALVAGNGFGWGTWKTVFTQGPSRFVAVGGSLTAVTIFIFAMMTATLVVAGVLGRDRCDRGESITMPALSDLARVVRRRVPGAGDVGAARFPRSVCSPRARHSRSAWAWSGPWWSRTCCAVSAACSRASRPSPTPSPVPPEAPVGAIIDPPATGDGTPGVLTVLSGSEALITVGMSPWPCRCSRCS